MLDKKNEIERFLDGENYLEGVVSVRVGIDDSYALVWVRNSQQNNKIQHKYAYYPFVWATKSACRKLCGGRRDVLNDNLKKFGIACIGLDAGNSTVVDTSDIKENGFSVMFKSKLPMSWIAFSDILKSCGVDFKDKSSFLMVSRAQQFMMETGIRYYKGFNDYNDIVRTVVRIEQNGKGKRICLKTNNRHYMSCDNLSDMEQLHMFFRGLIQLNPDVITGYSNEDIWGKFEEICNANKTTLAKFTNGLISKDGWVSPLKIGENVEDIYQCRTSFAEVTDCLSGIKRAQAADSDFRNSDLDYAADYLGIDSDEPMKQCLDVEYSVHASDFRICKMLPVSFQECAIMGTATQWKLLLLTWCYTHNLAVPPFRDKETFVGGLSRMFRTGYVTDIVKLDYNSLYPSVLLTWKIPERTDYTGAMAPLLDYVLSQRELYKNLVKKDEKIEENGSEEERRKSQYSYMVHQCENMSYKRLGNSFFGMYGAPHISPFASLENAEMTTCIGRQCLRLMVSHFRCIGYEPILGDTDGINWKKPDNYRYNVSCPYIGKGLNRNVEKGREYVGCEADVAEFNEMYFNDELSDTCRMGLGIDDYVDSEICLSRKNYINYYSNIESPKDVHMTGNIVKSRSLPDYIVEFLDKGVRLLLKGDGKSFVEYYYDTVERIYNYRIPLRKIASKGKVKRFLNEYKQSCESNPDSIRQAWMELAILEERKVNIGDVLYYVNIGEGSNCSDVMCEKRYVVENSNGDEQDLTGKISRDYYQYTKKAKAENIQKMLDKKDFIVQRYPNVKEKQEIKLQAVLLGDEDLSKDTYSRPGIEYNPSKYISMLNSRIQPLLVCFRPEIAAKILVSKPSEKPWFSVADCRLVANDRIRESSCDTYEQLMMMDDREISFWKRHPEMKIPFLKECGMKEFR